MRRSLFVLLASAMSACVLLTDLDGFSGGTLEEAGEPEDGGLEADALDPTPPDGGPAAFDDAGCPLGTRGPRLVRTTTFCTDSTEVTVAHYREFLDAVGLLPDRGASLQPAVCSGNTTFVPAYWYPRWPEEAALPDEEIARMPISVVDWCDAKAYCQWAGKRLCGKVGGGAALTIADSDTVAGEWFVACSRNGSRAYPYGPTFEATACNDQQDPGKRLPVGNPTCEGGFDGLFEMSGNVEEWIDACEPEASDAGATPCAIMGGAFNFPLESVLCGIARTSLRSNAGPQSAIRCCADAQP